MKTTVQTKTWLWVFAALLILLVLLAVLVSHRETGQIARVYQDGVCIRSINLSSVQEPFQFTVTDGNGHTNTVAVEPGRIRVVEANCPDQICVRTGWISNGLQPIVCLPAKLCIELTDTAQTEPAPLDAVIG